MRLHRFYIPPESFKLAQVVRVEDRSLLNQWGRVFRYRVGNEVVLFDGVSREWQYRIERIDSGSIELELVSELKRKLPATEVHVFFSLLKKDKNEWVLQKCTELGVSNFVPIIAERSEKTGFNIERAEKIIIEAAEQCGRSDIPTISEPIGTTELISSYSDRVAILICDEDLEQSAITEKGGPVGVLIGPEGGWTEAELEAFKVANFGSLHLGQFTLRAETAAIVAADKLINA